MPMNASTSGKSCGSSSRKRWDRQPETTRPWPRWFASRTAADSRMVSTLSSCAESMNEQVLTMTTSARAASLVISTPALSSEPSMISASTRFLAHPREISPTRKGRSLAVVFGTGRAPYAMPAGEAISRCGPRTDTDAPLASLAAFWQRLGGHNLIPRARPHAQPLGGRLFQRPKLSG